MQKMLPDHRTFISSHQYNSRPSVAGVHESRGVAQPQMHQIPARPLNVQPRSIANPFHAQQGRVAKQRIYDRLHPRNTYHPTAPILRPEQPSPEVKVTIPHFHQN